VWKPRYERTEEDRREERREYEADVFYAVWRSGGNPDAIDYDHTDNAYYNGIPADDCAHAELRAQRPREPEPEYPEPDYYDQPEG